MPWKMVFPYWALRPGLRPRRDSLGDVLVDAFFVHTEHEKDAAE